MRDIGLEIGASCASQTKYGERDLRSIPSQVFGSMHFLEDAKWELFYKKDSSSAIQKSGFGKERGKEILASEAGFALHLQRKEQHLSIRLSSRSHLPFYLERLKLSLYSPYGKGHPISLHPEIDEATRFQIFKQGFLGSSISNKKHAQDRNSWRYHESSISKNPEQVKWESQSPSFLHNLFLLPRGCIHSDHFIYLEEICPSLPHEWGEENDTPARFPVRFLASAGHPGQQILRFFVKLHSQTGQLIEFHAIWDFGGRLLPPEGRFSLTGLCWRLENIRQPQSASEIAKELRRTCSHVLLEHHERIAKNFHCKIPKNGLLRFWTPLGKDIKDTNSLFQGLAIAKDKKFNISHVLWPESLAREFSSQKEAKNFNQEIKKTGVLALARVSPFLLSRSDPLADKYADLFLPEGSRIEKHGEKHFALDPTHPDYRAFLRDLFRNYLDACAFSGLVLEDLFLPTLRGHYKNPQTSAGGRLRDALLLVRKAAGRQSLLVGADCPFWPAIGLLDVMQVSGDFGQSWQSTRLHRLIGGRDTPAVRKALISVINHSGMHGKFWKNAPGAAHICHDKLNSRKQRLLAAVLTLGGGVLQIADNFSGLRPEQMEFLARILAIQAKCQRHTPVALHVCESSFPRGFWNPAGYLGIWNPTEHSERIELPIPRGLSRNQLRNKHNLWGVYEERVAWRLEQDRFSIALGPFDTIVVKI